MAVPTTVYILLSVAFALLLVQGSNAMSCEPCYRTECRIAVNGTEGECYEVPNFSCLPIKSDCVETTLDPCGCCQICAPSIGERCSVYKRCQTGLKCAGMTGGLHGTCRARLSKQERMERNERRTERRLRRKNKKVTA